MVLLSSFIVMPALTSGLFLVYMSENNIFSYDFFSEGVFGMKVFFFVTLIFLVLISVILAYPILVLSIKGINGFKKEWGTHSLVTSISLISLLILVFNAILHSSYEKMLFLLATCILISTHIYCLVKLHPKKQFISLVVVAGIFSFMSLRFTTQASALLGVGLKTFGIGGNRDVSIILKDRTEIKGKLVLVTPKFIYVKLDNEHQISCIPISSATYFSVSQLSQLNITKE